MPISEISRDWLTFVIIMIEQTNLVYFGIDLAKINSLLESKSVNTKENYICLKIPYNKHWSILNADITFNIHWGFDVVKASNKCLIWAKSSLISA